MENALSDLDDTETKKNNASMFIKVYINKHSKSVLYYVCKSVKLNL